MSTNYGDFAVSTSPIEFGIKLAPTREMEIFAARDTAQSSLDKVAWLR
jgi:hypothetical protein